MLAGLIPLLTLWLTASEPAPEPPPQRVRVMTVEQQVILHVPVQPRPFRAVRWDERKGPKCLPVSAIAGAALSGRGSIDFVLRNRLRLRARLDGDCDGLGFYGGFYMQPDDNQVCVRRDVIRSRAGAACRIEKFNLLVPQFDR